MSNTVCCFHFSIVNQGKNISEAPKELENQPCRKFESCMIGKTGDWYLRKNLVLFGPPDMQKTQEFPGFFGVVSFLIYPSGGGGFFKPERKAASISSLRMVSAPSL